VKDAARFGDLVPVVVDVRHHVVAQLLLVDGDLLEIGVVDAAAQRFDLRRRRRKSEFVLRLGQSGPKAPKEPDAFPLGEKRAHPRARVARREGTDVTIDDFAHETIPEAHEGQAVPTPFGHAVKAPQPSEAHGRTRKRNAVADGHAGSAARNSAYRAKE
jgi:hypothetical protein